MTTGFAIAAPRTDDVYVGPRPFATGEKLYGRDREAGELLSLLIAERVALLYSPSGAGKTSLVQASLVPAMREEGFRVAPVIRVGLRPPGSSAVAVNRYRLSALLSLEEHRPQGARRPASALAGHTLEEYLRENFVSMSGPDGGPRPLLLIFDQFEELLRLDPTDEADKHAFVREVGEALRDRDRWTLFAMREDYVAALDPYRPALPRQLTATYRLDLLHPGAAAEAIRAPAAGAGVSFEAKAVRRLVDDLRQLRVYEADGAVLVKAGPLVEPVHLQVVCRQLWRKRKDPGRITVEDLESLSDEQGRGVDGALAGYYAERVAEAARAGGVSERLLRGWVGRQLITGQGVRRPALSGEEREAGVSPACLAVLDKAFLIRGEHRGGALWYELAHDRLVVPVLQDNARWRQQHLTPFQHQAEVWEEQGRRSELLLGSSLLGEAEQLARAQPGGLTAAEAACLEASRAARRREQRTRRYRLGLAGAAVLFGMLVAGFLVSSRYQRAEVAAEAKARQRELERHDQHARLLTLIIKLRAAKAPAWRDAVSGAADVLRRMRETNVPSPEAEELLREALTQSGWRSLIDRPVTVRSLAFSPDGRWLAAGGVDGKLWAWEVDEAGVKGEPVLAGRGEAGMWITALAFDRVGDRLISGNADGKLHTWKLADGRQCRPAEVEHPAPRRTAIGSIKFGADRYRLLTTGVDGSVCLWDPEALDDPPDHLAKAGDAAAITAVAYPAAARRVYAGTADGSLWAWDPQRPAEPRRLAAATDRPVTALAASARGDYLAAGPNENGAGLSLWRVGAAASPLGDLRDRQELGQEDNSPVTALAFSGDGRWLSSLSLGRNLRLWRVDGGRARRQPLLPPPQAPFVLAAFSPGRETRWLVGGGGDGTVWLWDLKGPVSAPLTLRGHTRAISALALSADDRWLATASYDDTVRFWDLARLTRAGAGEPRVLRGHGQRLQAAAFSPDSRRVAAASRQGSAWVWSVDGEPLVPPDLVAADEEKEDDTRWEAAPAAVAFGAEGRTVTAVGADLDVLRRDLGAAPGATRRRLPRAGGDADPAERLAISPDARSLAVMGRTWVPVLYDLSRPDAGPWAPLDVAARDVFGTAPPGLAVGPAGRWLLAVRKEGVELWDIDGTAETARRTRSLPGPGKSLLGAARSEDGRWVAAGLETGTVCVWDTRQDQARPRLLSGEVKSVGPLAFGATGGRTTVLVAGGADAARYWRVDDEADPEKWPSVRLAGHAGPVRAVAVSPDGQYLLSAGDDGAARLWTLPVERLLERAEEMMQP